MTFDSAPSAGGRIIDTATQRAHVCTGRARSRAPAQTSGETTARALARSAGLRYVCDADTGLTRQRFRWIKVDAEAKFGRMLAFGEALPRIRRTVARALRQPGMPRDKVLAAVVQLLDATLIRVGNDEYARKNRSYGLTTLLTRHVQVNGTKLHFDFRGKSGVAHQIALRRAGLAAFVNACLDIPGPDLFQYLDDNGKRRAVTAADVNAYLQTITGAAFTAKNFRTWGASALALRELATQTFASQTEGKRLVRAMLKSVAERLGNTPGVCRKSYIDPGVVDAFLGERLAALKATAKRGLRQHEAAFLALLRTTASSDHLSRQRAAAAGNATRGEAGPSLRGLGLKSRPLPAQRDVVRIWSVRSQAARAA